MPVGADPSFGWQEATEAFVVIAVVAFLVTWIVTDLAHVRRGPYVGILTLVALSLGWGYLARSGTSLADLVVSGWVSGVVAGVLAGAIVAPALRRMPTRPHPVGPRLAARLLWVGVVYGTAEALLLATLPVLALWQGADALGWTDAGWSRVASGTIAILGAMCVIVVHHIGYREFRARGARSKMVGALAACSVQALAFLLTGNILAPVVAHVLLHGQMIMRGIETPPVEVPAVGTVPHGGSHVHGVEGRPRMAGAEQARL